jgi:hypothetical protein
LERIRSLASGRFSGVSPVIRGIRRRQGFGPGSGPPARCRAAGRFGWCPGVVLIDRVKRICECDRGGRAAGTGESLWPACPEKCLHASARRRVDRFGGRGAAAGGLPLCAAGFRSLAERPCGG